MSVNDLIATMVFLLKKLDAKQIGVNKNTVHNDVLGDDNPHNEELWYEGMISTIIAKNNGTNPNWPASWLKMPPSQLAPRLLS